MKCHSTLAKVVKKILYLFHLPFDSKVDTLVSKKPWGSRKSVHDYNWSFTVMILQQQQDKVAINIAVRPLREARAVQW